MDLEELNTTYEAEILESFEKKKGCWKCLKVGVFEIVTDKETKEKTKTLVGEYERNYPSLGSTFYPFYQNDQWYALYSKDYMYTRVMSLPDCKDLGGEDGSNVEYKNHFCPMEYFVPTICIMDFKPEDNDPHPYNPRHDYKKWCRKYKDWKGAEYSIYPDDKKASKCFSKEEIEEYKILKEKADKEIREWWDRHPFITKYTDFGFVSGCFWGDDTSAKVEFIDLREVSKGIIKRDDRFGYVELPYHVKLKDAIEIKDDECDRHMTWEDFKVELAVPAYFNINSGKRYREDHDDWWSDEMKKPSYGDKK